MQATTFLVLQLIGLTFTLIKWGVILGVAVSLARSARMAAKNMKG